MHIHFKYIEIHTNAAHKCTYKTCKNNLLLLCYTGKKKIKSKHGGTEKATCIIHLISIVPPFEPRPNHFVH